MKKSILKITILLITPIALISGFLIFGFSKINFYSSVNNQITDIYITGDGKISVKQKVKIKELVPREQQDYDLYVNQERYKIDIPIYSKLNYMNAKNIQTNIDVINNEFNDNKEYIIGFSDIQFTIGDKDKSLFLKELYNNNNTIEFSYELDAKDIFFYDENKKNIILTLIGNVNADNENIVYLHIPNETKILNDFFMEKMSDENTYKIKLNNKTKEIEFNNFFTKDIVEYVKEKEDNEKVPIYFYIISLITLLMFGIVIVANIRKHVKIDKEFYERNPEEVIDPILAESIIDGKINAKDLIMTCIVELIYKKKLELINDDTLKLIDIKDLNEIEIAILKMMFLSKKSQDPLHMCVGKIINISNLNDVFIKNNNNTLEIYDSFLSIKRVIKNELRKKDIINHTWDKIFKNIKSISIMLIFNVIILPFVQLLSYDYRFVLMLIMGNIFIYKLFNTESTKEIMKMEFKKKRRYSVLLILIFICCFIITSIYLNLYTIEQLLIQIFIIITNIIIINISEIYIFTENGKKEYIKVLMLKKYIKDYSLMKERDIEEIIIFDEYLIYATAFGIPNKITRRIGENLMNLNVKLQIISKILTL